VCTQSTRRLPVGQPQHVDGHKRVAAPGGQGGDRRVDGACLECRDAVVTQCECLVERHRLRPPLSGAALIQVRVAQDAQQVAEVVVAVQQPPPAEHTQERVLDEVFGLLARAAECPSGSVEPVEMVP